MKRLRKFVLLPIFLLTLLLSFLFIPLFPTLSFEFENTGEILAFLPIEKKQKFDILYTHSVHLTPVQEKYVMTDEHTIKQYELIYESYNVGMPSNVEEGEKFVEENGKFHIKNMDRRFPFIDLSVGEIVANHRLIMNDKVIPFHNFVEPGTWVRIKFRKLTALQYWRGDEISGG
ncbi:DUF1850 domain-containing protein [Salirhabdus sp. Marseille-P4669]|uniref:DUF1850 domain-containing protein n=1 Tax=Salirhabdus sp. Marseille-P4669 TaxID=2042310 RepID=UPI00135AC076|nr:DUF1850 domain-containing protein [Salirhabdus sp. Marseille-P4669]